MSRKAFGDVETALEEALAFSKGEDIGARAHIPPELDVRRIRKKMKLTQDEFAAQFGFNVARLRDWEQGRTHPDAALRAYLLVIDRKPEAVPKAFAARTSGNQGKRP
jgi:putative transcriptional regulator